ncbi:MAG: hypothetical protein IJ697_03380 [Synergistaceae bacterium]|nr:hypothetical protein [Synergistaceae bacterium]
MRTGILGLAVMVSLTLLFTVREVSAHGTGYRRSELRAVALEFMYSTGEKMSYREAKVFSPRDEKFSFQSGRTDEAGRFSFVPDTEGKWRVIVRDEEGHQCTAEIDITSEFLAGVESKAPSQEQGGFFGGTELLVRALLGVSIIFNIAVIIWGKRHAHQ